MDLILTIIFFLFKRFPRLNSLTWSFSEQEDVSGKGWKRGVPTLQGAILRGNPARVKVRNLADEGSLTGARTLAKSSKIVVVRKICFDEQWWRVSHTFTKKQIRVLMHISSVKRALHGTNNIYFKHLNKASLTWNHTFVLARYCLGCKSRLQLASQGGFSFLSRASEFFILISLSRYMTSTSELGADD